MERWYDIRKWDYNQSNQTYLFTGLNRSKIGRFNKGLDKSPGFV